MEMASGVSLVIARTRSSRYLEGLSAAGSFFFPNRLNSTNVLILVEVGQIDSPYYNRRGSIVLWLGG